MKSTITLEEYKNLINKRSKVQREKDLQEQCVLWFRSKINYELESPAILHHSANSTSGGYGFVINNKKMGVHFGHPDFTIYAPGAQVMFIELKSSRGAVSPRQKDTIVQLRNMNFIVEIIKSLEDFQKIVLQFLKVDRVQQINYLSYENKKSE
jgi:hypothetical protein